MKRIMIIGCAGSGKSTLARRLHEITGLPLFHTDHIQWKEGWVLQDRQVTQTRAREIADYPSWIFEGAAGSTINIRISQADTLIILDLPVYVCLFRVLKRIILSYGKTRSDMARGCPEQFDWGFLKWIYHYRRTHRSRDLNLMEQAPKRVTKFHFKNQRSVELFILDMSENIA